MSERVAPSWLAITSAVTPLAVSLAANITWGLSTGSAVLVVAGVVTPLLLVLAIERWRVMPPATGLQWWVRTLAMSGVVVVVAGWSWLHATALLLDAVAALHPAPPASPGEAALRTVELTLCVLAPLAVDGLAVLSVLALDVQDRGWAGQVDEPVSDGAVIEGVEVQTEEPGPVTLYRLFGDADELLYVGITSQIRARMTKHRRKKEWWDDVVTVRTEQYDTREEALRVEALAIMNEQPRHNVQHRAPAVRRQVATASVQAGSPAPDPVRERAGQPEPEPVGRRLSAVSVASPSATDDDRFAGFSDWVATLSERPSKYAIRQRYGCGNSKAGELLASLDDDAEDDRADRAI